MAFALTEVCPPAIRFAINEGTRFMILVSADTHKRGHSFAVFEPATARVAGERSFKADEAGMVATLRWAKQLGDERVWALEDCRHVAGRLERFLLASGERVIRVAPKLMGQSRKGEREPGKSDPIDARAIGRAVLREGVDAFPVAVLDDQALEIRLLADHRQTLVSERTRLANRLRWNLVDLDDELEARIPASGLNHELWTDRINRRLQRLPQTARVLIARHELRRIRELTRDIAALEKQLHALVAARQPALLQLPGCGTLSAAALIGRTGNPRRFPTDGHFARQAGVAPIPASSGKRQRQRLNRGGDRQLNAALHRIAITQARHHQPAIDYIARRTAENKTQRDAIRCLKRHLARTVWHLLQTPAPVPGGTGTTTNFLT